MAAHQTREIAIAEERSPSRRQGIAAEYPALAERLGQMATTRRGLMSPVSFMGFAAVRRAPDGTEWIDVRTISAIAEASRDAADLLGGDPVIRVAAVAIDERA
jgi:hypothetical protein